jgi:hypothetical protein
MNVYSATGRMISKSLDRPIASARCSSRPNTGVYAGRRRSSALTNSSLKKWLIEKADAIFVGDDFGNFHRVRWPMIYQARD